MPLASKPRNARLQSVVEPPQTIASLIDTLIRLLTRISSRLWKTRLSSRNQAHPPTDPDVGPTLKAHLAQIEAENLHSKNPPNNTIRNDREPQVSRTPFRKARMQTRLSSYLHANKQRDGVHNGIGYQMQVNTKKHISKALLLSRQGNSVSAMVYAEMAQNAMREASSYMGSGEYQAFKQEVDERLLVITGAHSSSNR